MLRTVNKENGQVRTREKLIFTTNGCSTLKLQRSDIKQSLQKEKGKKVVH